MDTANHLFAAGRERRDGKGAPRGSAIVSAANTLRRVIDNDNFVSAVPRTVSNERPLPLAPSWRSVRMERRQGRSRPKEAAEKRRGESSAQCAGSRERGVARRVPPADSSFLPN